MSDIMRPRYGTKAENDAYVGLDGEISVDRDGHNLRVHDGVTAGGHEILPKAKNDELYLNKAGDTMDGVFRVAEIRCKTNDSNVTVMGSNSWGYGSYIELYGQEHANNPSVFRIHCRNMTTGVHKMLEGTLAGRLIWDGKDVITSAGGKLTGDLVLSGRNRGIFHEDTASVTIIAGGTNTGNGGSFYAIGGTSSDRAGQFICTARTETLSGYQLVGTPEGNLAWGGKNVVRVEASGSNYLKFSDGTLIARLTIEFSTANTAQTTTLPTPFVNKNYTPSVVARGASGTTAYPSVKHIASSSTPEKIVLQASVVCAADVVVVGRWK